MEEIIPITPNEVLENRIYKIHPSIIKIVNDILSQRFTHKDSSVVIKQKEIVDKFQELHPDFSREKLYDEKHMDFEYEFRKFGWDVAYDRPGYNENYEAFYKFSIKK